MKIHTTFHFGSVNFLILSYKEKLSVFYQLVFPFTLLITLFQIANENYF
jgi:hypothetical protein